MMYYKLIKIVYHINILSVIKSNFNKLNNFLFEGGRSKKKLKIDGRDPKKVENHETLKIQESLYHT